MGLALTAVTLIASAFLGNVELDASARAGVRVRSLVQREGPGGEVGGGPPRDGRGADEDQRTGEMEIAPTLSLSSQARLRLRLTYSPALYSTFQMPSGDAEGIQPGAPENHLSYLHQGDLQADTEVGHWTFRGGAGASHGLLDPLSPVTPISQPVSRTNRFPYRNYFLRAGAALLAWADTAFSLDGNVGFGGGIGENALEILPAHREILVDGRMDHEASERTSYGATISLLDSRMVGQGDAAVLRLGGSGARLLSREATVRLSGGLALAREQPAVFSDRPGAGTGIESIAPWAEASFQYHPGDRYPTLTVRSGAEPAVDRFRGALDNRVYLDVGSGWSPHEDWAFLVTGTLAFLEPWLGYDGEAVDRTWLGNAGFRVDRSLGRDLSAGVSIGSSWQKSGRSDLPSFREMTAFLEITGALPR